MPGILIAPPVRALRSRRRSGAAALLFALVLLPVLGFIGLAIDFGFLSMAQARLNLAADAAVLQASTVAANAFQTGTPNYLALGQAAGLKWFNAQAGTTSGLTYGAPQLTLTQVGGVFSASLTYQGSLTTTLAAIFGVATFPVNGQSTATITVGGYADIAILMDDSSSMGIGATPTAMSQLAAVAAASPLKSWDQNQACGFGCHWDANSNDFYGLARSHNIPLRIDVLNQAVQTVITTLIAQNTKSLYSIGLYAFNTVFTTIYAMNSNLSGALAAQQAVTVPIANPSNQADTNFPLAMNSITPILGVSGNGATAASPRKFLFLVTDGVADYNNTSNQRVISPMLASNCSAAKANGITILVLYTQYYPITTNAYYNQHVAPIASSVVTDLQECASSPQYFFAATDPASIQAAMLQMLQIATSTQDRFIQ